MTSKRNREGRPRRTEFVLVRLTADERRALENIARRFEGNVSQAARDAIRRMTAEVATA